MKIGIKNEEGRQREILKRSFKDSDFMKDEF